MDAQKIIKNFVDPQMLEFLKIQTLWKHKVLFFVLWKHKVFNYFLCIHKLCNYGQVLENTWASLHTQMIRLNLEVSNTHDPIGIAYC